METSRVISSGLAIALVALIMSNWELMQQVQTLRLVDAGTWASFCF